MIFNSEAFAVFLPIVFLLYWFATNKNINSQNLLLLVASYVFYGWWDWRFLFLLVFSTSLDYYTALKMFKAETKKRKMFWFWLSISINLGFLGVFKYYNFFASSLADSLSALGWTVSPTALSVILPVGISFYTFHGLSYVIDIYKDKIEPETNVITYSLFVSFFPLLVAGPIERATHLLPQIKKKRFFTDVMFREGIFQIATGFFRKMVIADNLAVYVDSVYGNADIHNSSSLLLASIFYTFQIYFDFSGYSDIAIGTAKLFGFSLKENFNFPYFSKSLTEFWRRWHMSLSFWLRDYLYISLGGNRKGIKITYRNLMITMLLGGLWHGASWNFVIWGGIHGLVLSIEKFTFQKLKITDFGFLGSILTFAIAVTAWVFFRSPDIHTSVYIISKFFTNDYGAPFIGDINIMTNTLAMLFAGLTLDTYLFSSGFSVEKYGSKIKTTGLVALISIFVMCVVLFYSNTTNFIYFQF
ncbi:MBOAT family O-acyltransferase [Flavobacterium sp.]|uniref:MBOAT family O-acyltransferase n=1 Tax=Flavobacterium sp. TaxID=239 RepID=UPI0025DC61D4|nr:MBOAT family O-acyltransferase [Flavobacterium sp.]